MTLIPDADCARAIDMVLAAKKAADAGNLTDAIEHLRDLEIWATDFNDIVWRGRQEQNDAEDAAIDARFGIRNAEMVEPY